MGELNRMREHLEVCLEEAIDCGKKTEIHKNNQICKKNRENSELLKEINDLRRRIRTLELENKEKDRIIFGVSRSELPQTAEKEEKQETENESMNR